METVRINKYLSEVGYCSRREADRLIENGAVTVNGETAEPGQKVTEDDQILVYGNPVHKEEEKILLLLNKPKGIVCTTAKEDKDNVIDFLHYPKRVYPVGRLDKDSEGLLLLTNQGSMVNKLLRSSNCHEKEYIATVDKVVTADFIKKMSGGVYLPELEKTTRPCVVKKMSAYCFRIVLTQGYNRQIRRMCTQCGYRVTSLKRTRIMNLKLGDLPVGQYRHATEKESRQLWQSIKDSAD